ELAGRSPAVSPFRGLPRDGTPYLRRIVEPDRAGGRWEKVRPRCRPGRPRLDEGTEDDRSPCLAGAPGRSGRRHPDDPRPGPAGPLGLRYRQVEGVWDVLAYALPVELVGGAHDGGLAAPGFSLDLHALRAGFTRVEALTWDAHGTGPMGAEYGPCISVEGEF